MGLGSHIAGGGGPKFNPMQVNQVFNECLHKEFRFQGSVKRRPFRFSLPQLRTNNVTRAPNLRTKEAVREQLSKGCNSPRMIRELQNELGRESITPMPTPPDPTQAATLCYKSVKDHLKENKLNTADPQSGKIKNTLHVQKMLPPERQRLPETMAQEVGWLATGWPNKRSSGPGLGAQRSMSVPGGLGMPEDVAEYELTEAQKERPNFWWKPKRPCPETEYARVYFETLQSNPFSGKGMFPDAPKP